MLRPRHSSRPGTLVKHSSLRRYSAPGKHPVPTQPIHSWATANLVFHRWTDLEALWFANHKRAIEGGNHGLAWQPRFSRWEKVRIGMVKGAIPIDPLQTNSDFAWPFRISIGMHIPHCISPVPTIIRGVTMMITTKEDQFRKQESVNSNFTMIPRGNRWILGTPCSVQPSMIYLWFICIYLYLSKCSNWNFRRMIPPLKWPIVAVGVHSLSFVKEISIGSSVHCRPNDVRPVSISNV